MSLTPENWKRINELFDQALVDDGTQCLSQEQEEIAHEVRSLLAAHRLARSFLATPAGQPKRPRELQTGDVIGEFWILKRLGQGSLATVYLADQSTLGRKVALKVAPNVGEEGRNMAPLEHDHIVRVFAEAVETSNNVRWTCMQYVPGLSLDQLIARIGALAPADRNGQSILQLLDEANTEPSLLDPALLRDREALSDLDYLDACLWLTSRLAQALDYAHRRGVLHLDVKPANILVNPYGRPLITDFNISQRGEGAPVKGGTAKYMSPEQSEGFLDAKVRVDGRADVYSLGRVLQEMLALSPQIPTDVAACLAKCLEENPEKRLRAAELVAHLESLLELREIERQLPKGASLWKFAEVHPTASLLFFIFVPQIIGSFINITYNASRIVKLLSMAQQNAFAEFVIYYNLIFYPLCGSLLWKWVVRPRSMTDLAERRQHVLAMPDRLVGICILGWMPGSFLFPAWIHFRTGDLSSTVYGHFFISFTLSCLIAMTYSFLYTYYLMVRVKYPKLWTGTRGIQKVARDELRNLPATLRLFYAMAGIVPLAGAALILWTGVAPSMESRLLVTALLVLGIAGLLSALRSSALFSQTIYAFTGIRSK